MKSKLLVLAALLACLSASVRILAQDVPKEPSELTALRTRFTADFEAATRPVKARYVPQLQSLLKTLTQRGDLAGATAVQKELDILNAPGGPGKSPTSRFSGTKWRSGPGDAHIQFKPSGNYSEQWAGRTYGGSWQAISESEVFVTRSDKEIRRYIMNDEGTSIHGPPNGAPWSPDR